MYWLRRIYAGAQGTIDGKSFVEYTGLKAGDVKLKDPDKY